MTRTLNMAAQTSWRVPLGNRSDHSKRGETYHARDARHRRRAIAQSFQLPCFLGRCPDFVRGSRTLGLPSAAKARDPQTNSFYRRTPTRLTPPFKLPPALCRTAARATGRGLSTTPALATQPCG